MHVLRGFVICSITCWILVVLMHDANVESPVSGVTSPSVNYMKFKKLAICNFKILPLKMFL